MTYPEGYTLVKSYDALNRLAGIVNPTHTLATYVYNGNHLSSLTYANTIKTDYSFDAIGRLAGMDPSLKSTTTTLGIKPLAFSYDRNSNILGNGQEKYQYDSLDRLNRSVYQTTNDLGKKEIGEQWGYDSMGNRTDSKGFTETGISTKECTMNMIGGKRTGSCKDVYHLTATSTGAMTYAKNTLNQYESTLSNSGTVTTAYAYDRNGNLTSDGKQNYAYDYRNRLIEVKNIQANTLIAKYSYDVLGRRIGKETSDTKTSYVYSNNDAIEETLSIKSNGEWKLQEKKENVYSNSIDDILNTTRTVYGTGDTQTTSTYYYHKNQLGSIIAITNAQGTAIEEYRYDSFGKAYIRDTNSNIWKDFTTSTTGNTRLFTGREYDSETNLYYYRARYYSASLGRFISRDPIGTRDDVNLYGYVGNSPVGRVDPDGKKAKSAIVILDMAYNQFVENQKKYQTLGGIYRLLDNPAMSSNPIAYSTKVDILGYFAYDTLSEGSNNIKLREDYGQHTTVRDQSEETKKNYGHPIGGEFYYQGNKIYLADLGNIIYGFNASNLGVDKSTMDIATMQVTLSKFGWDKEDAKANETDDTGLIYAGYDYATKNSGKTLSKDEFRGMVLGAAIVAENIRLNQKTTGTIKPE